MINEYGTHAYIYIKKYLIIFGNYLYDRAIRPHTTLHQTIVESLTNRSLYRPSTWLHLLESLCILASPHVENLVLLPFRFHTYAFLFKQITYYSKYDSDMF